MMASTCDILVIIAHPDDAEFGAAGSVAAWTAAGGTAVYAVCTNGDKGTSDRTVSPADLALVRQQEQHAAASVLGVSEVVFLGLEDQGLEETPEFLETIVRLIRTYRPDTVVSMDPYRRYVWHRDHRIVGRVVLDALFPFARDHLACPNLLEEGLEPHKVKEALFFGADEVNHWIDISDTFELKLEALACHASQVSELKVDNLESWLRARCRRLAEGSDFTLAEAFHRVRLPD